MMNQKPMSVFLSIIIPAYNEEQRLGASLIEATRFLDTQPYSYEIIVVENGSSDRTLEIARTFAREHPTVRALHLDERGKGLAVQAGMLHAGGDYRFICDADFSMPVDQVNRFFPPLLTGVDVAIASREAAGAVRYNEPAYRHIVGRAFNTLVRWAALPELHDTQCGFKCFTAKAAEQLFSRQTISGWSFDVEVLFIARLLGYVIHEVPIPWYFNPQSRVKVLRDSLQMGADLLRIRRNARQGKYNAAHPD